MFSGIGAFEKALQKQNISYELINFCEIDKYASKAYSLIHNEPESKNLGDITKVDETQLQDFDLMTYGFPCQDISIAGKQKGIIKKQTRSGLLYEALRIAKHKKPKYMIAENVESLVSDKFKEQFNLIIEELNKLGYNNYWELIDSSCLIPQQRKRVFIISIRKDIDNGVFDFNFKHNNKQYKSFYDLLEYNIDKKYIKLDIYNNKSKYKDFVYDNLSIIKLRDNGNRITHRNDGLIYTLTAGGRNCGNNQYICKLGRVITPKESFRFMGFEDEDYYILKKNDISDTQLYKMAGNSIVVNVLEQIYKIIFQ